VKNSVPNHTFQEVSDQLQILKEKQADWIDREVDLYKKLGTYETMDRENLELQDKLRESEETRVENESEFEIIKRRLEALDPAFKREQDILKKVIGHFKRTYTSPEQAFLIFDRNGDGKISRDEFRSAIEKMGLRLTDNDLRALINQLDTDRDGNVRYLEFTKKMARFGVRSLTEEQQIIKTIFESI
jgi:hypothetical protein